MVTVHPQFVIDEKKRHKAVLLSVEEWRRIMEELQELDDIRAYDKAKAGPRGAVPFEKAIREIEEGYR